jgi:hypothetical protein
MTPPSNKRKVADAAFQQSLADLEQLLAEADPPQPQQNGKTPPPAPPRSQVPPKRRSSPNSAHWHDATPDLEEG